MACCDFLFQLLIMVAVLVSSSPNSAAAHCGRRGSTTHLRFYMHDYLSGPNQTAFRVVKSPFNFTGLQALNFGDLVVIDDPLTAGPNLTTSPAPLGRAQGVYVPSSVSPDPTQFALLLVANLVIRDGPYNGSTVAIMGRDDILSPVREIPVVGGSGAFCLARGYVLITTFSYDAATGNAVLELNAHIFNK